jgi:hypothetical protein
MSFSMNFTIDADLEKRTVLAKIYGVWKKETAEEYHAEFRKVAQPLIDSGKEWAKIVNLSNWKSSYPEMVKVIGEHMRWTKDNGNTLSVYVIDNPITRNQLKKMFHIGGTAKSSKTVRTLKEAEKILADNGF